MNKNEIPVKIESKCFEGFRNDFDESLYNAISTMQKKDSDEAEITMKITIKTISEVVTDEEQGQQNEMKIVKRAYISHKIASKIALKSEKAGNIAKGDSNIEFDKRLQCYVLRKIDDGQMSMFDMED